MNQSKKKLINKVVGNIVKQYRNNLNLNVATFSAMLSMNINTYYKYESGANSMDISFLLEVLLTLKQYAKSANLHASDKYFWDKLFYEWEVLQLNDPKIKNEC